MAGDFFPLSGDQVINAAQRIEYVSATKNYYGLAAPGTTETMPGWAIREETLDSQGRTTAIKFANGTVGYSQQWSLRATYSYS